MHIKLLRQLLKLKKSSISVSKFGFTSGTYTYLLKDFELQWNFLVYKCIKLWQKCYLPVNFDINLHLQAELHLYLFQGAYQSNQGNIKTYVRLISLFS